MAVKSIMTGDSTKIFHMSKTLLKYYRKVSWNLLDSAAELKARCKEEAAIYGLIGDSIEDVLYGMDSCFIPDMDMLEGRLQSLYLTKTMIDLVNKAMLRIKGYPEHGELYYSILYWQFTAPKHMSETEILSLVNIERTTFYKRKKEAIELLGIILWGFMQPEFIGLLKELTKE